jgi:hypothetical protein
MKPLHTRHEYTLHSDDLIQKYNLIENPRKMIILFYF